MTDRMRQIKEYFKADALGEYMGIELVEVREGSATARMKVRKEHFNAFGMVHGAAIFALADCAFAAASNSHGRISVALNASISFLRPAGHGTLTARASEVSCSRKIATYRIDVTDQADRPVAVFQGMVYRKRDVIPGQAGH